jgi:hypothetical protein
MYPAMFSNAAQGMGQAGGAMMYNAFAQRPAAQPFNYMPQNYTNPAPYGGYPSSGYTNEQMYLPQSYDPGVQGNTLWA